MNIDGTHLSIDTETVGWPMNAIVGSIAIVPFNFMKDKDITFDELVSRGFYVKLDCREQKDVYGRKADKPTMKFWETQPTSVKELAIIPRQDDLKMKDALERLNLFVKNCGYQYKTSLCFERGMGYDSNKIEHMFIQAEITPAINFWRCRELRTFNDLLAHDEGCIDGKWELPEGRPHNYIEHHCLHDAAIDALRAIRLFHK